MTGDKLGFVSRDRFDSYDTDGKLGMIFDFLVAQKDEQKERCGDCREDFDGRYEKKRSTWWTVGQLTLLSIGSALGGFGAALLGYTPKIPGAK